MELVGGTSLGACKRYLEDASESNPKRRRILPAELFEESLFDYSQSFQNQSGWISQEREYTVVHTFCPPEQPLESNSNESAIPTRYSSQLLQELQNPTREVQSFYPSKELLESDIETPYTTSSSMNSSEEFNESFSEHVQGSQNPIDEVDQQIFPKDHLETHAAKRTRNNPKQVLIETFSKLPGKFQKLPDQGVDRKRLDVILDTFRLICLYAEGVVTKGLNIQHLKDVMNEKRQQVDHFFPGDNPEEQPYIDFITTLMDAANAFVDHITQNELDGIDDLLSQLHISKT